MELKLNKYVGILDIFEKAHFRKYKLHTSVCSLRPLVVLSRTNEKQEGKIIHYAQIMDYDDVA